MLTDEGNLALTIFFNCGIVSAGTSNQQQSSCPLRQHETMCMIPSGLSSTLQDMNAPSLKSKEMYGHKYYQHDIIAWQAVLHPTIVPLSRLHLTAQWTSSPISGHMRVLGKNYHGCMCIRVCSKHQDSYPRPFLQGRKFLSAREAHAAGVAELAVHGAAYLRGDADRHAEELPPLSAQWG